MSFLLVFALVAGTLQVALVSSSSFSYSDYPTNPGYSFSYEVLDPYTGQDFGHTETRKDDGVNGEYRVLLPDDRIQVVRYTADQNGYVADVQYADGSSSPAYGKAGSYSSGGYSGGASAKVSSYFNPPMTSGYYGGPAANSYAAGAGYNKYQPASGQLADQAFKSGCVCQCPA